MKRLIRSILILLSGFVLAQNQIRIEYEIQPDYDFEGTNPGMNIIAKKAFYELIADREESQYNYMEKVDNEQPKEMNTQTIIVEIGSPGIHYVNTKEKFFMKETEVGNKRYIIKDSLTVIDWKIQNETKEVEGIQVRKATASLKNNEITAWYAPKITYKSGPDKYWGLPGIILELETVQGLQNGGKVVTTYKAVKIEILGKDKKMNQPNRGKIVTSAEIREIHDEANKKMREMYGDGVDKE
ncbi:MAG: GLPGLI family protein [Weeksellaceae bacterium]|nr:GLPGLI family protein [Weeksellaceae bacterium]